MSTILTLIGFIILVWRLLEEKSWNKDHPGLQDVDAAWKDSIKVTSGTLSQREYRKRLKSGYYNK